MKIQCQGHLWGHSSRCHSGSKILLTISFHDPPNSQMRLLPNLTMKIQIQGHGWDQSARSHSGSNTLLTHILFMVCQSTLPFPRYDNFKLWHWKFLVHGHIIGSKSNQVTSLLFHMSINSLMLGYGYFEILSWIPKDKVIIKVKVQGHIMSSTCYKLTSFSLHVSPPFQRYGYFEIWPWMGHGWGSKFEVKWAKSKVIVIVKVKIQGHIVSSTLYQLTSFSFHVIQHSHSRYTAIFKFDHEWVMGEVKVQVHIVGLASYILTSLCCMWNAPPTPEIYLFKHLTLKIWGQGHRWGPSLWSQSGSNILSTGIHFITCQSAFTIIWLF